MSVRPLGELAEQIDYGLTASARKNVGPKFLRITDLQDGSVDWDAVPGCDATGDVQKYLLSPGDIVFARTGATTGKSYLIRDCPTGTVFASYLIRVRPGSLVFPAYLAHFFDSPTYWSYISASSNGSAQAGVNATKLRELGVPLPPLPEQRRIAAILDEADALRRKRREALGLLDELLQSAFLEMFGDPVTNPRGWESVALVDVVVGGFRNGLSPSSKGAVAGRVLTLSAVTGAVFDPTQAKNALFDKKPHADQFAVEGLFLICRGNGNLDLVGKGQMAEQTPPGTVFPDTVIACSPRPNRLDSEYLLSVWGSRVVRAQIESGARTTNGIHKVNQQLLAGVRIPLPPMTEQRRFSRLASEARIQRTRNSQAVGESERLFDSLLQRAFTGERSS